MSNYLLIAQLVVSIVLIAVIMMQVKGGGLGGIFGQADTVYRTRRGAEKRLFQFTIALTALFVVLSIFVVRLAA